MNKLFEVREFDNIISNINYKNSDNYKYIDESVFKGLLEFIREFSSDEKDADVLNFMRISYKRNVGEVVTIKNYVGLIQMKGGYQIQILPKISFDSNEDSGNSETKKIFLKMLKSMKDFPSKVFSNANLNVDSMNLYEIFINMYLQEVRILIKRGIKSSYVRQEGNLKFYKGKLLTSQHIKTNITHKERFYVAYDEFHPNRSENKLVKATLLKLQKLTSSSENSKEIRQLLTAFEMIEPSVNHSREFSQVKIDRTTKDYEILMQWSRVFLLNKSFTTFSGENTSRALLFPMESVYESYVAQQIKKTLGSDGWSVSNQDKGYYLFTEPRKQFGLRPDIVCKKGDRIVVMDTKWKNLIKKERANYGISQSDMYQMYASSKKYKTPEVWLLYPLNDEMRNYPDIKFDSGDGTLVRLHFVDLTRMTESMEELREKLIVSENE